MDCHTCSVRLVHHWFRVLTLTLILALATWFQWQYRFAPADGPCIQDLESLSRQIPHSQSITALPDGGVRLFARTSPTSRPPCVRLDPAELPVSRALLLRFRLQAHGIELGANPWEDGRLLLEWVDSETGLQIEMQHVAAVRYHQETGLKEAIALRPGTRAKAILHLQQLGSSGYCDFSTLEIIAVNERGLWKYGRWFTALAWLAWITSLIRRAAPAQGRRKAILAALLWVTVAAHFTFPGPWHPFHPFGMPFPIRVSKPGPPQPVPPTPVTPPSANSAEQPRPASQPKPPSPPAVCRDLPVGNAPNNFPVLLKIKEKLAFFRFPLHLLLFATLGTILYYLAGARTGLALGVAVAGLMELCAWAFGFGFNGMDILDLGTNGAGLGLALLIHRRRKSASHPAQPASPAVTDRAP